MNKKLDPTDWVDYLLQTGAVDSWGEYAEWVKSTPKWPKNALPSGYKPAPRQP